MSGKSYLLLGRSLPERALISVSLGKAPIRVNSLDGNPAGDLHLEIVLSHIFARFESASEVKNLQTLRNIVEDAARAMLDVAGFFHRYGYEVEITSAVECGTSNTHVFGIDIPAVKGLPQSVGLTIDNVFSVLETPAGHFFRSALADARAAIRSPRDTGFYCYRAIESLKNGYATVAVIPASKAWDEFRTNYAIDKNDILEIKKHADADRHGDVMKSMEMSDVQRALVFTTTWKIISTVILKERKARSMPATEVALSEALPDK